MQEIELLVSTENGSIVTNIEVIKKHIAAGLEEYKHMVFTEETKKEAKATVADLRKLKKEVNARKIEVKKRYMAPYEDFETQAKELMSLIVNLSIISTVRSRSLSRSALRNARLLLQIPMMALCRSMKT